MAKELKNRMRNNPLDKLLTSPSEQVETQAKEAVSPSVSSSDTETAVHPEEKRRKPSDRNVKRGWTRQTFLMREDLVGKFDAYAYTERLAKKDAINIILETFFHEYEKNHKLLWPK